MVVNLQRLGVRTTWGVVSVVLKSGRVVACELPLIDADPPGPFRIVQCGKDPVSSYLVAVFRGDTPKTPLLGDLKGTEFQGRVWRAILQIPAGKTSTYGELAGKIGRPRSCRAVAAACGRNPVPLFIPCHRVVGANGWIGGFSSGIVWKKLLLTAEKC